MMNKPVACEPNAIDRLAERLAQGRLRRAGPGPATVRTRPNNLEEAKLMFRVSVQAAAVGPLRHLTVKRVMMIAFGIGTFLGAFPAARRKIFSTLLRRFNQLDEI